MADASKIALTSETDGLRRDAFEAGRVEPFRGSEVTGAVEAQYRLLGRSPRVMLSFEAVRLDAWVLRAFEQDLDAQIDALVRSAYLLPDIFRVALRADGGLWLVVGHGMLSVIFAVPPDAWMPSTPAASRI